MRAVLQRVRQASVEIDQTAHSEIKQGLLIFLGIEEDDSREDIEWLCHKIIHMRIFADENNAMNISLKDINGEALIVSQFTLHASVKKGNRPSFIRAAKPGISKPLYEQFLTAFENQSGKQPKTGIFGADMKVQLCNDGPVTIIIDSKNKE